MRILAAAIAGLLLASTSAHAGSITVDEILYPMADVSPTDALDYSGTVDMTYSGGMLTITLTNTTALNSGITGANTLLTGIGFTLPGSLYIQSGSANALGETAIGFTMPGDGDVSEEWGYDTQGLMSGSLLELGVYSYDDAVSAMESQTEEQFQPGSLAQPPNLDGPDFGLLSNNYPTSTPGSGVEAIQDSIVIKLNLGGSWNAKGGLWTEADLLNAINGGAVALTFGSPTDADGNVPVPEPGTFALLGAVLGAGWFLRRRRRA